MKAAAARTWNPAAPLTTPYARAGQLWDRLFGEAVVRGRNWRLAFFLEALVLLPSVLGNIYLGAQTKIIPYMIEVDVHAKTATVRGPTSTPFQRYNAPDDVLRDYLKRFVLNTRSISSDTAVIKQNWAEAYKFVTTNAANTLDTYAQKDDPAVRAQTERISVDIVSIVRRSKDSWQVDWRETRWSLSGQQVATDTWLGIFRLIAKAPDNEEQLRRNPLGTYIDELHWSKLEN